MNCKMICFAAGFMMMLAGCNEQKTEVAVVKNETAKAAAVVSAAPAPAPAPAPVAQVSQIDWAKALEMNKNGAMFVDVRNPPELNDGFVEGSVNIPLPEFQQRFAELPKDKELLIYCRSGRRSEVATKFLMQQGYEHVHNVMGGYLAFPKK